VKVGNESIDNQKHEKPQNIRSTGFSKLYFQTQYGAMLLAM
jgi:hypothetical protein